MKFSITTSSKCEIFAGIFHNLRTFVDNVNIQFSKQGLHLQTMDNSRVSVFELVFHQNGSTLIRATWKMASF